MTVLIATGGPNGWANALAAPERQWRSGYSARTAAHSWEAAKGLPPEIAACIGPGALPVLVIAEHKVAMPGGGFPSQCDVFALVDCGATRWSVAVEAKVDEPFGPTIADWLAGGGDSRKARLDGICAMLGLTGKIDGTLRYQLFHRTASAVVEAKRLRTDAAAMVVQSFSETQKWFQDYAAFARLFEPAKTANAPIRTVLPNGLPLTLAWAAGDPCFRAA